MELTTTEHTVATLSADGIATVTITTDNELNILTTQVINEARSAVAALAGRDEVRVLVVRGRGNRAFLGGADITEMAGLRRDTAEHFISQLAALCEALRHFPTPVLARLAGWCLGGGLEVALACDLRISSDNARFGMPEVELGIPSVIHAALLPRLVGHGRAAWLTLTGQRIDASTALSWGLINETCAQDNLDETVEIMARRFTELGPAVLRQQKRLLRSWETTPPEDAIPASIPEFGSAFDTGEPQRFMSKFLERKH